jgi:sodium/proline symporter
MQQHLIVLYTLIGYNTLLILIGVWASRRNRDEADFFLGGRRLGGWVSALSASASSSSAWTLLGVSGAAYAWGLSALWLFPATLGGFLLNWCVVAPRLRRIAAAEGALTLSALIAPPSFGAARRRVLRVAAGIILFSFMFYIASQFDGAGKAFLANFGWSREFSIALGGAIVLGYTLLGGFWAVSVTDSLQALMMVAASLLLPAVAVLALDGGAASLLADAGELTGPWGGAMGIAFVAGTLGIGLGYPGQPHVVNRFMATSGEREIRRARIIAIAWAVVVYAGMLTLGLAARVLFAELPDGEQVLFRIAGDLLPPVLAGMVLAAVLSAIMSTADSQLLTASSAVAHDWRLGDGEHNAGTGAGRRVVLVLSVLAILLALYVPEDIFSRVLFAWSAIGSAFGPLVLLRIAGRQVSANGSLAAMLAGFLLTVLAHWLPNTPGDWVERIVPFVIAAVIATAASRSASARQPLPRPQATRRAAS